MAIHIEDTELPNLVWSPGKQGTVWFLQPRLRVDPTQRPFMHRGVSGEPHPLDLMREAQRNELTRGDDDRKAPTLFLAPEFALGPADVGALQELAEASPPSYVFITGLGQMDKAAALAIDNTPALWPTCGPGTVTNCAVIAVGGSRRVYVQPKIVPSALERDYHCRGRAVRFFVADGLSFAVLICSEMFDRPDDATTVGELFDTLRRKAKYLRLLIWIQHNEKPRSVAFVPSLRQVAAAAPVSPTVFLACSRADRPQRLDNYSVSGAIARGDALPTPLGMTERRFHYAEPVEGAPDLARVVLLRYDAEAYRVRTCLADSIDRGVETSAFFEESEPFVWQAGSLTSCSATHHVTDVTALAGQLARKLLAGHDAHLDTAIATVAALDTPAFLRLLDLAIVPDRPGQDKPTHSPSYRCQCWRHRRCIDELAHDEAAAAPLAHLFVGIAMLAASGLTHAISAIPILALPRDTRDEQWIAEDAANVQITIDGHVRALRVMDPASLRLDAIARNRRDIALYLVVGPPTAPVARPRASSVDVAKAAPVGPENDVAVSAPRFPNAIYTSELWDAYRAGILANLIRERLGVQRSAAEAARP